MANRLRNLVGLVAGVTLNLAGSTAWAKAPVILVSIDSHAAIPPDAVEQAKEYAAGVYSAAGLSVAWEHQATMTTQPSALRVTVALLSGSAEERIAEEIGASKSTLGFAPDGSRRAYIFGRRIVVHALSTGEPIGLVLGRVLAHELGHLLLPRQGHSETGIMRAQLDEWPLGMPAFTDAQAIFIRTSLAR